MSLSVFRAALLFSALRKALPSPLLIAAATLFLWLPRSSEGRPAVPSEALGPCSRRTPLVISEVMYHPAARGDGRNLQYVELHNSQPWFADLSGFRLAGDIDFVFPEGTRLEGKGFLVVAQSAADMQAVYPLQNVFGPWSGQLGQSSGEVRLENRSGAILLDLNYSSNPPWPAAPDGAGPSLVLSRPSLGERDPAAWAASVSVGGSPGGLEPTALTALQGMTINEFLVRPGGGESQFIELYNRSAQTLDLAGCSLSVDPAATGFVFPEDTTISPGGFLRINADALGYALSPLGGTIYLVSPDGMAVLDAVRYEAPALGVSLGRSPDGGEVVRPLASATPGSANASFYLHAIVINEIMYHAISEAKEDEYVELYNRGGATVDLGGWRFVDGIDFIFPAGTLLPAGGFPVVGKDAAHLRSNYPQLTGANTFGDFQGALSDGGERVALARPEQITTNDGAGGLPHTNLVYVVVDEVTYGTGGEWGEWADGDGSSLELIDAHGDHRPAANWADSDESAKATWTTVEFTGKVANYITGSTIQPSTNLHVLLLGKGECYLDDVEAIPVGQANLVNNSTFNTTLAPWSGLGNHGAISIEPAPPSGNSSLRLRSHGRGDTTVNHVRGSLSRAFKVNDLATLRARARWLHGRPELLLRLAGNYLEAYGRLPVPANLGSPGLPNTRALANGGPIISGVTHFPLLPPTNRSIVVRARVQDPDGVASVRLNYRLDPQTTVITLPMLDDGTAGDAVAGDGIYTATIPAQTQVQLIAFHVAATDAAQPGVTRLFPADTPARECLVRVGDPAMTNQFGIYRLWMTQSVQQRWTKLSNDPLPVTFVYGEDRALYRAGAMYGGSPYAASSLNGPTGFPCDYAMTFQDDDRFLGDTETTVSWPGLTSEPDPTAQSEQLAYWFAEQMGLPFDYRRYVLVFANGVRRGSVMEDTQQPDRDLVEQWFPNQSDGDIYKIQIHYDQNGAYATLASLEDFAIADSRQKLTRYRWNFAKRAPGGSMNDYRTLLELVSTLNLTSTDYTRRVAALVDVEEWMTIFAVERVMGNWDSFGYANGQNMYAYKPLNGRWQLLIWDVDFLVGGSVADPPSRDIFTHANRIFFNFTADPTTRRFFAHPPFRRVYLRAMEKAVNEVLPRSTELLDAKTAAFASNQLSLQNPSGIKTYLSDRRANVLQQLARFRVPFALTSNGGQNFSSATPVVSLAGTASFEIEHLQINGVTYDPVWTSVTNWSVQVPLAAAMTPINIVGVDAGGSPVAGATAAIAVSYTGTDPLGPSAIFINEWMASNAGALADPADGDFDDWFELFNPNPFPIDLQGYRLTDSALGQGGFTIGEGVILPESGYLLVWADEEISQNPGRDLHVNFNLRRTGESITLLDPQGRLVDQVNFGLQTSDVSEGRWPDGAVAPFWSMPVPTPGAANTVPAATPPVRIMEFKLGTPAPGLATLTWNARVGARYQVQSTDHPGAPGWAPVAEVMAGATNATVTLQTGNDTNHYYRIEQLK